MNEMEWPADLKFTDEVPSKDALLTLEDDEDPQGTFWHE